MIPIRALIASWLLVMAGIACFAQVPMTGAGKGAPGGGGGSMVTVDQVGAVTGGGGPLLGLITLTISAGLTDSALIAVLVNGNGTSSSAPTATWDYSGITPQTMTLLKNQDAGGGLQVVMWGLRSPHSGNLTLLFTIDAGSNAFVNAISFSNVQQSSDAAAFPNFTGSSTGATPQSLTITSGANNYVIAGFNNGSNYSSVSDNQLFIANAGIIWATAANYAASSGSTKTLTANPGGATGAMAGGAIAHD